MGHLIGADGIGNGIEVEDVVKCSDF